MSMKHILMQRPRYPRGSAHNRKQWPWALTALIFFLIDVYLLCGGIR